MAIVSIGLPRFKELTDDGVPLVGGKLYTYVAGTTTPLATYTDATGTTPNPNPIVLDARGECSLWVDSSQRIKLVLTDADDGIIWSEDGIIAPDPFGLSIEKDGAEIVASPSIVNFTGNGVVVTHPGGGEAVVNVPGQQGTTQSGPTRYFRSFDDGSTANITKFSSSGTVALTGTAGRLRAQPSNNQSHRLRLDDAPEIANGTIEVDLVCPITGASIGLDFRTTNWGTGIGTFAYMLIINTANVTLYRGANSTSSSTESVTVLASTAPGLSAGVMYRVRIDLNGSSIRVTINNTPYFSVTDATYSAAGRPALYASGDGGGSALIDFDNVQTGPFGQAQGDPGSLQYNNNGELAGSDWTTDGTKFTAPASTSSKAPLCLPHGTAPSAPADGDVWTTTTGVFARVNGATVGPFGDGSSLVGINDQSGTTYTLVLTDLNKVVRCNNESAITLTVPANSSVAFPIGSVVTVRQVGAGQVTIAAAGGVTINSPETLKTRKQHASVVLVKVATDEWDLGGDLE